jgi:hypothetical protein
MGFGPEIQLKIMRAIDGLENIEIIQPGSFKQVNKPLLTPSKYLQAITSIMTLSIHSSFGQPWRPDA